MTLLPEVWGTGVRTRTCVMCVWPWVPAALGAHKGQPSGSLACTPHALTFLWNLEYHPRWLQFGATKTWSQKAWV